MDGCNGCIRFSNGKDAGMLLMGTSYSTQVDANMLLFLYNVTKKHGDRKHILSGKNNLDSKMRFLLIRFHSTIM